LNRPASNLQDLYQALILEHSRSPRHFGPLAEATHTADGINPLCGDKLRLYLKVDEDRRIALSRFEGTGCAVSVASASMLTDGMAGLCVDEAELLASEMTERLVHGAPIKQRARLAKFRALDAVREYPGRIKCATLAWEALRAALNNETTPASTEQD
jgi:nitrogen fixation NifU-like protein